MTAFANPVETVAGSDYPGIGGWALQIFAKVFEHRGRLRRHRRKIIERFIHAGRETRGRHVVAQNSAIHDLREEACLRDEFAHQVRNIFLAFGRECFLIAGTATKGDDHNFSF